MKILIKNKNTNKIEKISEQDFQNENEIQKLILKNPDVIPFEEIEDGVKIVKFIDEFGIPNSGSSDLVGIDNNANIYILECKLASNPEIKRKVIGQILEYASFLWEMGYKEFNNKFIQKTGKSIPNLIFDELQNPEHEIDFIDIIKDNLSKGNFKLLIIVDKINDTLKRTIDFINGASNKNFEIIILEISLFYNADNEIYIPKLFGLKSKPDDGKIIWNEDLFEQEIMKKLSEFEIVTIKTLIIFIKTSSDKLNWGKGKQIGSVTYCLNIEGNSVSIFSVLTNGKIWLSLPQIRKYLGENKLIHFLNNLKEKTSNFKISQDLFSGEKWPEFFIKEVFKEERDLNIFEQEVKALHK